MVAAAETLKEINKAWLWIEEHILPEMKGLEDVKDKESFVISKFMSLVSSMLSSVTLTTLLSNLII